MTVLSVDVHPSLADLAEAAAGRFATKIVDLQRSGREPHVVLTGGGTGIAVLTAIAQSPACTSVDWTRLHVWWGDERFLPAGHEDRNDRQADDALLSHVAVDPKKVHRVPASDGPYGDDPEAAAAAYAEELAAHSSPQDHGDVPSFDILMLGLGEEGHTASIFPGSPAAYDERSVCAVRNCPKPPPTRVTLTFSALTSATEVWMMTTGEGKAPAVGMALGGAAGRVQIPAAGPQGSVATLWLLDRDAARAVPRALLGPTNR